MAVARSGKPTANGWMSWALWAAGVTLLLMELKAGMQYFEAGLQQNMGNVLGWAPAMGVITLKLAGQSVWHWTTVEFVLQALPLAALGLLLVIIALAVRKESRTAQGRSSNQ